MRRQLYYSDEIWHNFLYYRGNIDFKSIIGILYWKKNALALDGLSLLALRRLHMQSIPAIKLITDPRTFVIKKQELARSLNAYQHIIK